jgi:hypothetical protein
MLTTAHAIEGPGGSRDHARPFPHSCDYPINDAATFDVQAEFMSWIRKLDEPIVLKDGRMLATLAAAHRLMLALPAARLQTFHWQHTSELLNKAASRSSPSAFAQALAQLPRALRSEGLL